MNNASPDDPGSIAAVALRLMCHVSQDESGLTRNRAYWLTLYSQCLMATRGANFQELTDAINAGFGKVGGAADESKK